MTTAKIIENVQALGDRVLLQRAKVAKTDGAIELTDATLQQMQEDIKTFTVVNVGPNVKSELIAKGVQVIASPFARITLDDLEDDDNQYMLVPEDQIYGVFV